MIRTSKGETSIRVDAMVDILFLYKYNNKCTAESFSIEFRYPLKYTSSTLLYSILRGLPEVSCKISQDFLERFTLSILTNKPEVS